MTNWIPELTRTNAPIYVEIADAIGRDIDGGRLKPGEKLPPQRNLAFDINVTVGTVSRAYALARERGLVTGEVGRGTYVQDGDPPLPPPAGFREVAEARGAAFHSASDEPEGVHPAPGKLRLDSTSACEVGQSDIISRHMQAIIEDYPHKTTDYIRALKDTWQQAGQSWLAHGAWQPAARDVIPTLGVHAGMMAVIAAMSAPGDKVAFEALTYASLARAVTLIGRRAIAVPMRDNMLDPDALEHVCANQHPRLVVTIPTLHNPTTTIMPDHMRRRVGEIARRHNVLIVEDNIYGAKLAGTPDPIALHAPERTFHLSGLSKTVAAGLRAGWVACPPGYAPRIPVAHKLLTGGMPFLLAEKGARIVLSGEAETIAAKVREETRARITAASLTFAGIDHAANPNCPFIWLKLPPPWRTGTFVSAARDIGLLVDGDDEFQFTQDEASQHCVRVALSSVTDRNVLSEALTRLHLLLDAGPSGYDSYA